MRPEGVEPSWTVVHRVLSAVRLPFRHGRWVAVGGTRTLKNLRPLCPDNLFPPARIRAKNWKTAFAQRVCRFRHYRILLLSAKLRLFRTDRRGPEIGHHDGTSLQEEAIRICEGV